jgi:hypothetical protein
MIDLHITQAGSADIVMSYPAGPEIVGRLVRSGPHWNVINRGGGPKGYVFLNGHLSWEATARVDDTTVHRGAYATIELAVLAVIHT